MIYTIAPSPKDVNLIWVGTDDGLIHMTRDGGKELAGCYAARIDPLEQSVADGGLAFRYRNCYAAINRFRLDDLRPHIYRTHDGGRIWKEIVNGLPDRAVVNAVREDPRGKGLLFAGTEIGVFVSFDDGDNWQSLQLNLPVTSVRDLVIHEDDLVVGNPWAVVLDPRRYHSLTPHPGKRDYWQDTVVRARNCYPLAMESEHRYSASARRTGGTEPTRWSNYRLLH